MINLLAALAVGVGLALTVVSLLRRARARHDDLIAYLELPFSEEDVDTRDLVQRVGLLSPGAAAIDDALQRFEVKDKLADRLEKARVLLRPGEFVLLALASAAAIGMWVTLLSDRPVLGIALALFTPFGFRAYLDLRIGRRRRAFEIQLPATLSLLASSLRAGHTLLRAIELQVEEGREPMAGELERVLAETQLGLPLLDALDRMAARVELPDLEWVVHAVRIQQSSGGRLADLLFTLADFMRDREEVRREVKVLTAEGRISAWVVGLTPVVFALYLQTTNPDYMAELASPVGFIMVGAAAVLMLLGVTVIRWMIKAVDL